MRRSIQLRQLSSIQRDEILSAADKFIIWHQGYAFAAEIALLRGNSPVAQTSKLKSLDPFIDTQGVLRVGGRIDKSTASYEVKHPAILTNSRLAYIIVEELHIKNHHAGPTLLTVLTKQRYWVIGARQLVNKVIHSCVICVRYKAAQMEQFMGDLPYDRVNVSRAFLKVGLDYAGPINIYMKRGRGQKTHKAYVCVFVCMSTKAVHFELVGDLTTESFLAALRRFSSRRGACTDIYSDNGSNFIGANNHLRSLFKHLKEKNSEISFCLSQKFINWHFNAPAAPHTGGLFESAVKSMKFHLRRVIGNTILTYEELHTLIVEIEAVMNSRPLCLVSPDQLDPLTPAHFLIGCSMKRIPEQNLVDVKQSLLTRWQLIQQFVQHIWCRWQAEYLTSLQRRVKWQYKKQNVKIGDVVVIKEENYPPAQWALGIIQHLHPGRDGLVRTVTIKTKSTSIKRPVQKICRLPIESTDSTGAGNVRESSADDEQHVT